VSRRGALPEAYALFITDEKDAEEYYCLSPRRVELTEMVAAAVTTAGSDTDSGYHPVTPARRPPSGNRVVVVDNHAPSGMQKANSRNHVRAGLVCAETTLRTVVVQRHHSPGGSGGSDSSASSGVGMEDPSSSSTPARVAASRMAREPSPPYLPATVSSSSANDVANDEVSTFVNVSPSLSPSPRSLHLVSSAKKCIFREMRPKEKGEECKLAPCESLSRALARPFPSPAKTRLLVFPQLVSFFRCGSARSAASGPRKCSSKLQG